MKMRPFFLPDKSENPMCVLPEIMSKKRIKQGLFGSLHKKKKCPKLVLTNPWLADIINFVAL